MKNIVTRYTSPKETDDTDLTKNTNTQEKCAFGQSPMQKKIFLSIFKKTSVDVTAPIIQKSGLKTSDTSCGPEYIYNRKEHDMFHPGNWTGD